MGNLKFEAMLLVDDVLYAEIVATSGIKSHYYLNFEVRTLGTMNFLNTIRKEMFRASKKDRVVLERFGLVCVD